MTHTYVSSSSDPQATVAVRRSRLAESGRMPRRPHLGWVPVTDPNRVHTSCQASGDESRIGWPPRPNGRARPETLPGRADGELPGEDARAGRKKRPRREKRHPVAAAIRGRPLRFGREHQSNTGPEGNRPANGAAGVHSLRHPARGRQGRGPKALGLSPERRAEPGTLKESKTQAGTGHWKPQSSQGPAPRRTVFHPGASVPPSAYRVNYNPRQGPDSASLPLHGMDVLPARVESLLCPPDRTPVPGVVRWGSCKYKHDRKRARRRTARQARGRPSCRSAVQPPSHVTAFNEPAKDDGRVSPAPKRAADGST